MIDYSMITENFAINLRKPDLDFLRNEYSLNKLRQIFIRSENLLFSEDLFDTGLYFEFEQFFKENFKKKWFEIDSSETGKLSQINCFLNSDGFLFFVPFFIYSSINSILIEKNDAWYVFTDFIDSIMNEFKQDSFNEYMLLPISSENKALVQEQWSVFSDDELKFILQWLKDIFHYQKKYCVGTENYVLIFVELINRLQVLK